MREPVGAGELRDLVRFERQAKAADGYGNEEGAWEVLIPACCCKLEPTRAGGEVLAQRLQGVVMFDMWATESQSVLRGVTDADRAVDLRDTSRVFKILAPAMDYSGKRRWLLFQLTLGRADG